MARKRSWNELTPAQRKFVVVLGGVQVTLLAVAGIDLARRPADQVRGSKLVWAPVLGINFFGPIAYLWRGRRR